jgi:hypothetical protein
MPRVWKPLLLLSLIAAMMGTAAWSQQPGPVPREAQKEKEDEAILQDLEVVRELEMLQMLEMLQEMEILGEMDPSVPPASAREEEAR